MYLAFSEMAARSEISPARWRRPFLIWMDGIEAGWAIPLLLIGFVAVWMAFLVIAYLGGDLHPDVLETWTLGRSLEWGYAKHPPLMGWVARAWTSVFPLTNWSFQLLALTTSAIALWAVDLITRRFARGDKRIVVLLLLMLLPAYQFHAQRFNANVVLLPAWPIATYCFLRSFESRASRMGRCRRRNRRARDAGQILFGVSHRELPWRGDLSSAAARLFRFAGSLDFHGHGIGRARTAYGLAGDDRCAAVRLCA